MVTADKSVGSYAACMRPASICEKSRSALTSRMSRSAFSLGPLLTGAFAGAMLNRQETRRLGHSVRTDLRGQVQQGGGTG